MNPDLSNRVVVITGAAGNLGMAVARAFQASGAKLVLVDRSSDRLPKLFPDLVNTSDYVFAPPTDVTDETSVAAMVEETYQRMSRIDVLVNTAGGFRAGTPLSETPITDWDFLLNLNARSVFLTCRAVIPHMLRQDYGNIINIASRAALSGDAYQAVYSVSKTAVLRLTESMAAELKDSGVNANCVLPGIIDTPANRSAIPNADYSKWVTTDAVADVILFLASDGARAISGAAVPVFGKG